MEAFETYIATEKERLAKAKQDILARRKEADDQLTALDVELQAIAAYEEAKKPRTLPHDGEKKPRKPREKGKRTELLNLIKTEYPEGISRSGLITKLQVKGDKAGEQSLSNALSSLKKSGQLTLEDGTYRAA